MTQIIAEKKYTSLNLHLSAVFDGPTFYRFYNDEQYRNQKSNTMRLTISPNRLTGIRDGGRSIPVFQDRATVT